MCGETDLMDGRLKTDGPQGEPHPRRQDGVNTEALLWGLGYHFTNYNFNKALVSKQNMNFTPMAI